MSEHHSAGTVQPERKALLGFDIRLGGEHTNCTIVAICCSRSARELEIMSWCDDHD